MIKVLDRHQPSFVDWDCSGAWLGRASEAGGDGHASSNATVTTRDLDSPLCEPAGTGMKVDVARVLVMESQPIVALVLHLVLENRGYSVRDVGSRAEGPRGEPQLDTGCDRDRASHHI